MSMFGVIVPGRPCVAPTPATAGQPTFTGVPGSQWVCDLEKPGEISDILCFLTAPLPCDDEGAGIYYSIPPFTNWEAGTSKLWAHFTVDESGVLKAAEANVYGSHSAFLPQTSQLPLVKVGIMLEKAPTLQEKLLTTPLLDVKKEYARRVALNLYRYLESFQGGAAIPLLDQWFQRFEARYRRDPNFVMKSE